MIRLLLEWTFPFRKIQKHLQIIKETGEAIEKIEAALDGETGWLDCGCVEKSETAKDIIDDTCAYSQRRQRAN